MFSIFEIVKIVMGLILIGGFMARPDIPMELILKLQKETYTIIDKPWGSPAVFDENNF